MFLDWKKIAAVYSSCALLLCALFVVNRDSDLGKKLLNPLDNSYSVLGKHSVFSSYLGMRRVYGFLPYWNVDNTILNTQYVTDLSYFGLNVNSNGRIVTSDGNYKRWRENPKLATILKDVKKSGGNVSFTLICHNDEDIDSVLNCSSCWNDLAKDVEKELKWAEIKDINVDFEYSGYTTPENAKKYSDMVGVLNNYLDMKVGDSFVVVSTYADSVERSTKTEVRLTDPASLAQSADALFIMAYDFHRPTSNNAGPVSPLEGSYTTTRLNLTTMLESYLKVVPSDKLILGLPFYGYDWLVTDTSPMSSRIEGNYYIGFSRVATYSDVTDMLVSKRIAPLWDSVAKTPYVNYVDQETGSLRQIYYDNLDSLKAKTALARKNNLLGVGVWALGYEGGYVDLWQAFKSQP